MGVQFLEDLFDSVGLSYKLGIFILILIFVHIVLVVWLMKSTKKDAREIKLKRKRLSQVKKVE